MGKWRGGAKNHEITDMNRYIGWHEVHFGFTLKACREEKASRNTLGGCDFTVNLSLSPPDACVEQGFGRRVYWWACWLGDK